MLIILQIVIFVFKTAAFDCALKTFCSIQFKVAQSSFLSFLILIL